MAFFDNVNHKRSESDLRPGDHIYCYRSKSLFSYAHHGIYIGDGKVIHFLDNNESAGGDREVFRSRFTSLSGESSRAGCVECRTNKKGGVRLSCLKCFLKGDVVRLFYYGVSKKHFVLSVRGGSCGLEADEPELVLSRAQYLLETDGFGLYQLETHNCEDFAIYCKTGMIDQEYGASKQVELLRQVSKIGSGVKSNPFKIMKTVKSHLVDERWNRERHGIRVEVDALVKMYDQGA